MASLERRAARGCADTSILGFADNDATLYMPDSRGRDTASIVAVDLRTEARTEIATDTQVDLGAVLTHPATGRIQAVLHNDLRSEWRAVDAAIDADMEALTQLAAGEPYFVDGRTQDDATWIVRVAPSNGAERTYIYERQRRRVVEWFNSNPHWSNLDLQPLHAVPLTSRDGLRLPTYYMLPTGSDIDGDGVPTQPMPTIMFVHGGPWDRDVFGFRALFQLYANRGYAVLAVNFRGSTGFGKAFLNAANGEWGARMQDDLLDAKAWAVAAGITAPDRVAIVGGSYGGYAALAGMAFTPGAFACGISVAGPSSLVTLSCSSLSYSRRAPRLSRLRTRRV